MIHRKDIWEIAQAVWPDDVPPLNGIDLAAFLAYLRWVHSL